MAVNTDIFYKIGGSSNDYSDDFAVTVDSVLLDNNLSMTDTNTINKKLVNIGTLMLDPDYIPNLEPNLEKEQTEQESEFMSATSKTRSSIKIPKNSDKLLESEIFSESSLSCMYPNRNSSETSITNASDETSSALERYIALIEKEFARESANNRL